MKRFIAIIIALLPMVLMAQAVMGIPFGSSYNQVKQEVKKKFGYNCIIDETPKELIINRPFLGNHQFRFGYLHFQYKDGVSYFSEAYFTKEFDSKSDAENFVYNIVQTLLKKYTEQIKTKIVGTHEFIYFGKNPFEDTYLGFISYHKPDNNYQVVLSYGPINYVDESEDF